jgi:hypothetical protein
MGNKVPLMPIPTDEEREMNDTPSTSTAVDIEEDKQDKHFWRDVGVSAVDLQFNIMHVVLNCRNSHLHLNQF